jgi:hypothetical protein
MADLPDALLAEVETLTRRARRAVDDAEADAYRERRDALLADHGFTARVREEDNRDVLVCRPEEWTEDGVVRMERVEDLDRAAEVVLSGPGDPDEWETVYEENMAVADGVRAAHGDAHGDNAEAFAEFVSNHYAKSMARATTEEVEEFLEDYYVRNVWPSDEQAAVVEESVDLALAAARDGTAPE